MSCDNSTYHTLVDLDPCLGPELELGDYATARKTDLERHTADRSESKGRRREAQSRIIPDSTQIEPEYVWGDEGPIND
jgi:hypothetical protein